MTPIIPISIFIFVVLISLGLFWLLSRPPSAAAERLEQMDNQNDGKSRNVLESFIAQFVELMVKPVNRVAPPSPDTARKLQKKLMYAGYFTPNAPIVYRGIQMSVLIGLPGITVLALMFLGRPVDSSLGWLVGAIAAGYLLPRIILDNKIKKRQLLLRWGLADALDLLVISIEAGLGLNAAMVRVSDELKSVHPDISKEFELVNLEILVGRDRESALRNLAERTGVDDLRGLCAILIQADRFGTSIARSVRVYADSLRTRRRQRAEQAAQKAAVKLLLPLGVFLFPTLFIAILGPAAIQLIDNFFRK